MKLKRSEVMELEVVFKGLLEMKLEPTTSFKIASNVILASDLAEKVRKTYKPVDGYGEVEELRGELIVKLGGTPASNGGFTVKPGDALLIGAEIEAFNAEHADIIAEQKEYHEKFQVVLERDVEIEFEKIDLKELTVEIEPGKLVLMIKTGIIYDGSKP